MFLCNSIYPLPREGLFPHISVSTITTFGATSLLSKINGLNRQDKIYLGAMPSQNIPSLTIFLEHLKINRVE